MYKTLNEKEIVDFLSPERCYNIGEYLFNNFSDLKKVLFQDFSIATTNEVNNNALAGFYTRWDFGETPVLICLALPGVLSLQLYDLLFSMSPSCSNNLPEEEKLLLFGLCASLIMADLFTISEIKGKEVKMGYLSSVKLCYSFIFENQNLTFYPGLSQCLIFEITPFGQKTRLYALEEMKRILITCKNNEISSKEN